MPKVPYKGKQVDADDVSFTIVSEDWNRYQLHDGTEIRIRLVVRDILKIPREIDGEGTPVYSVRSSNVLVVRPSEGTAGPPAAR
ncbi:MAG: hypothetical protein IH862_05515 [Chloroflexi bacterium]|nr:hypothetical protein [Chloroflexota bacterium]